MWRTHLDGLGCPNEDEPRASGTALASSDGNTCPSTHAGRPWLGLGDSRKRWRGVESGSAAARDTRGGRSESDTERNTLDVPDWCSEQSDSPYAVIGATLAHASSDCSPVLPAQFTQRTRDAFRTSFPLRAAIGPASVLFGGPLAFATRIPRRSPPAIRSSSRLVPIAPVPAYVGLELCLPEFLASGRVWWSTGTRRDGARNSRERSTRLRIDETLDRGCPGACGRAGGTSDHVRGEPGEERLRVQCPWLPIPAIMRERVALSTMSGISRFLTRLRGTHVHRRISREALGMIKCVPHFESLVPRNAGCVASGRSVQERAAGS